MSDTQEIAVATLPKNEVITAFQAHGTDSGSTAVQVALLTARINGLQEHFSTHAKDHSSRRGLLKMVGQRKRLLEYIKSRDVQEYRALIGRLGVRK